MTNSNPGDSMTGDQRSEPAAPTIVELRLHYCSFCGKHNEEVAVMVAGLATHFICNECVTLCMSIIGDHYSKRFKQYFAEQAGQIDDRADG